MTDDQWEMYQSMAITMPQEQWLEFAREEEKSAPEPSDEPPPAASAGSEEAEVTLPEEIDEDAAARRERHARCRCFDLSQLKDFIRKEGSINGEDECEHRLPRLRPRLRLYLRLRLRLRLCACAF